MSLFSMRAIATPANRTPRTKVWIVVGGYLLAFAFAALVVAVRVALTSGPAWQAYSGMLAFGEALLFLAAFGLAALLPTGAALLWLRPYHAFWRIASVAALGIAITAVAALATYLASQSGVLLGEWSALSPLRLLLSPLAAVLFFLSAGFAPIRWCRFVLLGSATAELVAFVWIALLWSRAFS